MALTEQDREWLGTKFSHIDENVKRQEQTLIVLTEKVENLLLQSQTLVKDIERLDKETGEMKKQIEGLEQQVKKNTEHKNKWFGAIGVFSVVWPFFLMWLKSLGVK